ncbi:hypothetical protein COCON_G00191630 [Conger conger]|uniref:Transmembrane protein 126A n=1 Tax=Conger conger TaxID=82655 RepID=A0A9Q1HQF4_CONCO|nr:transmembrane protein 126A-like [Conger conger]KAJ8257011.1 hypothetical protein COCON_G00191630 [Conger conger]
MAETSQALKDLKLKSEIMELVVSRFEQLPETDKKIFEYGPIYLGINGAFAGLIANSFFRRVLKVTQARITSSLPMAILPFLGTTALFQATVSEPLVSGGLNCEVCAQVRGALVTLVVGGLYPVALALPINAGLASRYKTAPMPEKGKVVQFLVKTSKPVFRKMVFVYLLQAISGYYLATLQHRIYWKLLELPDTNSEDRKTVD